MNNTGTSVLTNFIWRLMERVGAQLVGVVVSIVLARILEPTDYGVVALINVVISILSVFISAGFSSALIQKKDADDTDFSSVFYAQMVICTVLYVLLFIASPYIAAFYRHYEMTPMIRVVGITLLIAGVKNVQISYVSKHMIFKKFFFATLGGTIGAAFVGIGMATAGFGAWALITQSLFNNFIDTVILWITVKWRPKRLFSFERLKGLFSYGWKLLVSALLDTGYRDLRSLIIGRLYTSSDLAFYNRGQVLPSLVVSNINSSIDSVLLPTMSYEQDNRSRVRDMTRRAIKTSTYLMMPMMMGLAVCAEPIVRILLTEKWLPSVFFMRVFCFTYAFWPIHTANLNAINAMGRSDLFLKLEIVKKIMGLIVLVSTMFISVKAMALSAIGTTILSQMINSWPNRKLLDYRYSDQVRDMLPQIALSCGMGIIVYCVTFMSLNDYITLLIQVPLGALIYLSGSLLFHVDSFDYMVNIAKSYMNKKGRKK